MKRHCILVLACLVLATLLASAAGTGTCIVKGTITDAQGKPVAGATVEFIGIGTGARYSTKTDKGGFYTQLGVVAGRYRVDISKDGQKLWTIDAYEIHFGTGNRERVAEERDASYENKLDITIGKVTEVGGGVPIPLTPAQQKALEELQKMSATAPQQDEKLVKAVNAKIQEAQAAQREGNWDAVVATLTEVTHMVPMDAGVWAAMGLAYYRQGKSELQADAYTKAVALKPSEAPFHQNLAVALSKLGKVDEAVTEFDSAAVADPAGAGRYFLYEGMLLNNASRDADALAAFNKAIAADPKLADAYYFKGTNLMKQAQLVNGKLAPPAGAAEAFRQYLTLQPAGPYADEVKAQLARLGG